MRGSFVSQITKLTQSKLLTGGGLLLIGMTIVNAGNYVFNLILGRWLGPTAFADLSLIVTLFLVITFVTAALQTTAAKYAATYAVNQDVARTTALRVWLTRRAWQVGFALMAVFIVGSPIWAWFFHTQDLWPFIIFAIGIPFYFVQGIDRGILQGQTRFGPLTITYQTEMWVRLILGCGLVLLGFSVNGAVSALTLSILATWAYARYAVRKQAIASIPVNVATADSAQETIPDLAEQQIPEQPAQQSPPAVTPATLFSTEDRKQITAFALPVVIGLIGQILINNGDVLIVKHFFDAYTAGSYAALALIGRIVFFATWSIVTALFPIVAQRHQRGLPHRHLLAAALGLVGVASGLIVLATVAAPAMIVQTLFDSAYLGIAPLLWMYAIATALYAMANVVISYRLSISDGFGSILALVAGIAQTIGLWVAHTTLQEIVLVQVLTMGALLLVLLVWDTSITLQRRNAPLASTEQQLSAAEPAIVRSQ